MKLRSSILVVLFLALVLTACKPTEVAPAQPSETAEQAAAEKAAEEQAVAAQQKAAPAPEPVVEKPEPTCEDSDGGVFSASIGSVSGVDSDGESYIHADDCVSSLAQREYYCEGGEANTKVTQCSCTAGACIADPVTPSLAQYPTFLSSDVLIVVGDEAPAQHVQAAISLATTLTVTFNEEVKTVLAREVTGNSDLILIGDACDNEYVEKLMGEKKDCESGELAGQGVIDIKADSSGRTYIFITGGSNDDIRKAAKLLAEHDKHALTGTHALVGGTLTSPKLIS